MKKINSISFGGKLLAAGVLLAAGLPAAMRLITGSIPRLSVIPGAAVLAVYIVLRVIETRQDSGSIPHYEKHLREEIPFDPERQTPVIRASICTGEKVAGFKDKETGHFTEVLTIRSDAEKERFMKIYGIDSITTEY